MHLRRVAAFFLGAWIIGSLFMAYIAVQNTAGVESVAGSVPAPAKAFVQALGPDNARAFLHYYGAELNRAYFSDWERTQLLMGPLLVLILAFSTRVNRLALALGGSMIVFVIFQHFVLTPEINYIGRALDFAPGWSGNRGRLWALRGIYSGLEFLKLATGYVLSVHLFRFRISNIIPEEPEPLRPAGDPQHIGG